MKNNSKSGLRISEILATLSAFVIVSTSTQLLFNVKDNELNENVSEIQIEKESDLSRENESIRRVATTSRAGIKREESSAQALDLTEKVEENSEDNVNDESEKYISIDEIKISKNMDLTVRCGISKEDFKYLMKNLKPDTTDFFYNHSDIIYDLCEKYQINEIFFCGLIAGESGWKISSNHRAKCNYISMMSKGKLIKYSTPEEGLEAAAKLLHNKYLTKGGAYYSGKTLANVQKVFCPNSSTWVNLVYGCMKQIVE